MKIKILIVDDEPLAQEVLENYVGNIPSLNLVGKCANAIDIQLMGAVPSRCEGVDMVMHPAFDQVDDQQRELCVLVELGVDRVLTSGGMPTAEAGVAQLRKLIEWSRDRIEILPGGGVRSENAQHILRITGCQQLHGTFKQIGHQPIVPDASEIARLKQLRIDTGKA